jgi:hypothetical protein
MSWLTKRTPETQPTPMGNTQQIEPLDVREPWDYKGDAEKLLNSAREGNENAARLLVYAGEVFAGAVEELFRESEEGRALIREIASESLTWPCIASRHQAFRGGPDRLKSYLEELELGSSENFNFAKQDPRTESRQGAARYLRRIAENHAVGKHIRSGLSVQESIERSRFVRDGLERDPWRKSAHGKAAKAAIEEALDWLYKSDSWLEDELLAPIVEKAKEGRKSVRSIRTAFVREALNVIHGMLWD